MSVPEIWHFIPAVFLVDNWMANQALQAETSKTANP